MASRNNVNSNLVLVEKWKFWTSTWSHKMCHRKQTTETKLLILVSFFSGGDTSSTETGYCIYILREICRSIFIGPPCIISPTGGGGGGRASNSMTKD